jgi:hypothetical protein
MHQLLQPYVLAGGSTPLAVRAATVARVIHPTPRHHSRWRREYYPPREACCPGNADPACDCTWGGYKYHELPPPAAYENIFADECDGRMSINRVGGGEEGKSLSVSSSRTSPTARSRLPRWINGAAWRVPNLPLAAPDCSHPPLVH